MIIDEEAGTHEKTARPTNRAFDDGNEFCNPGRL